MYNTSISDRVLVYKTSTPVGVQVYSTNTPKDLFTHPSGGMHPTGFLTPPRMHTHIGGCHVVVQDTPLHFFMTPP